MLWLTGKSQPESQPKKMSATISIICYRHKTLANGEHPIMLRISKDGKRTMKSLGISVNEKYWDFKRNQPRNNCPNKEMIQQIILEAKTEMHEKVLKKTLDKEEFTSQSILRNDVAEIRPQTVEEFYRSLICDLRSKGRIGNSYAYLNSYNCLKQFNKGKKLSYTFSHINIAFLRDFEEWMISKGNKETTLSFQFRTLRAVFNRAIDAKVVSSDKNPFQSFKIGKFNTKTPKRALSKTELLKIINAPVVNNPHREFAKDIFVFSYLCGGISFVDIAHLKRDNIVNQRLVYNRQKTHSNINLKICREAMEIIDKYEDHYKKAGYLFPILHDKKHITPMQINNRVHKICSHVNTELKNLSKELEIKMDVTTYVARHSFATILKKSGVNVGIISEALGHSDIATTTIYLSKFDNEQIDEAMKNLL